MKADSPGGAAVPVLFLDVAGMELHPPLALTCSASVAVACSSVGCLAPSASQGDIFTR